MKKVFQTIVDNKHGNCMQAAIATLFNKKLEEVPNFIEQDEYFKPLHKFITDNGYSYDGILYNKNYTNLLSPSQSCFKKVIWSKHSVITKKRLYKENGINGLFYAGVLSPKYFNWSSGTTITHAVIIDRDYNIVHDPNYDYKNILEYPLKNLLGYNGIIDVLLINKIK